MGALPRDLQKPRQQRIAEVYGLQQLQAGQANGQLVSFGCSVAVDTTTTKFQVTAGEYSLAQQVVTFAAKTAQNVPAGAATGAGQVCLVLIEADASGNLQLTVGAIVSANPVLPALDPTKIALGYLSIPASFVVGTTALTGGNCVTLSYSAGNTSPSGGF